MVHGQFTWSNHGGYNLLRAWPMFQHPGVLLESEVAEPYAATLAPEAYPNAQRWPNLDNAAHSVNSARITRSMLREMLANPGITASNLAAQWQTFVSVPLSFIDYFITPPRPMATLYPFLQIYRVLAGLLLCALPLALLYALVRTRRATRETLATVWLDKPHAGIALLLLAVIGLHMLTEHGEEFRFVLTLLPSLLLFSSLGLAGAAGRVAPAAATASTWWGVARGRLLGAGAGIALLALGVHAVAVARPGLNVGVDYTDPAARQWLEARNFASPAWTMAAQRGGQWKAETLAPVPDLWRGFAGVEIPPVAAGDTIALQQIFAPGTLPTGTPLRAGVVANGPTGASLSLLVQYRDAAGNEVKHTNYFKSFGLWKKVEVTFTMPEQGAKDGVKFLLMRTADGVDAPVQVARPGPWQE